MMTVESALKIVLVEDSPVLRELLAGMLDDIKGLELIGEADKEDVALAIIEGRHPDLAIIDLELNEGNGLNILRQIFAQPERYPGLQTVVFSNHAHNSVRERCRMLGARAFFDKTFQMDELLDYLQAMVVSSSYRPVGHH
jgi:two-component system OmpR family response regulator